MIQQVQMGHKQTKNGFSDDGTRMARIRRISADQRKIRVDLLNPRHPRSIS
jgi:hypothetical protein